VIDVAIAAIEIATACYFQQNGVDAHDRRSLAVVAVIGSIVAPRHFGISLSNLVKQARESGAIQREVKQFELGLQTHLRVR